MLSRIIGDTGNQRLNKWRSTTHAFIFKWITEDCYISDSVSVTTFTSYRELESCKFTKIIVNYHHLSAEIFSYYIIHVSTTDEFMWFYSVLPAIYWDGISEV